MTDLAAYRDSDTERARIADLMALVPDGTERILDVGARDGYISKLLAKQCKSVVALDLKQPEIEDSRIECVQGNAAALNFPDAFFDLVFCAEVLEHINPESLGRACNELGRVSRKYLLLGVPYKQDIRHGRTTCFTCGAKNPPWGHVNQFDERILEKLIPSYAVVKTSYVGLTLDRTNFLSTWLMDLAGNPFGTYSQDEPCIVCGALLKQPPERNLLQKAFTRFAHYGNCVQRPFIECIWKIECGRVALHTLYS